MPLTAPVGGDFELPPEDTHIARCYRVIDMGTTLNPTFNVRQHKVMLSWELPECLMKKVSTLVSPFPSTRHIPYP